MKLIKEEKIKTLLATIIIIIALGFGTYALHQPAFSRSVPLQATTLKAQTLGEQDYNGNTKFIFKNPDYGSGVESVTVTTSSPEPFTWVTNVEFVTNNETFLKEYQGYLYNAYFDDHIGIGFPKLVIVYGEAHSRMTSMLEYNTWEKTLSEIDFIDKDGFKSNSLCCSDTMLIPMDNGVQNNIGVPHFLTDPYTVDIYKYDFSEKAFVEQKS